MAHDLTISPANTGIVTVPDDGDDLVAASVEVPLQQVGNWIKWVYDRVNGTTPFGAISVGGLLSATGGINAAGIITTTLTGTGLATLQQLGVVTSAAITTNLTVGGTATVTGILTTATHATVGGNIDAAGSLSAGSGSKIPWRIAPGSDTDTTVVAADADLWVATLTATRTWTLSTANAVQGLAVRFHNDTPASYDLNIEAGSEDCSILPGGVATYYFNAGAWRLLSII